MEEQVDLNFSGGFANLAAIWRIILPKLVTFFSPLSISDFYTQIDLSYN